MRSSDSVPELALLSRSESQMSTDGFEVALCAAGLARGLSLGGPMDEANPIPISPSAGGGQSKFGIKIYVNGKISWLNSTSLHI